MANSIWRKKPVSMYEADIKRSQLRRVLGRWGLTSLGIGAIIGGGIFTLTGIAANQYAGPALALAFVIAGIGCLFASLCYAEFASVLPVEGSAYAYAYGTVGEMFAWFIGWNLVLEYMMGATTVAVSWSGYFVKLLHLFDVHIPLYLSMDLATAKAELASATGLTALQEYWKGLGTAIPDLAVIKETLMKNSAEAYALIKDVKTTGAIQTIVAGEKNLSYLQAHYSSINLSGFAFNLPAFLITWVVTAILIKGIKEAASTNNIIVVLKVAVVLFVIIAGAFFVKSENWHPFIPERVFDANGEGHFGWAGVITAATIVFFAYIGFDAVSTQAGEAINPKKDIPFAIIASLIICTILYILVSLVLTGMVRYDQLDLRAPVASAFDGVGITWAVYLIVIAATAGLTSVMLVMMLGQTRIFLGMAKDGLLPRNIFASIHPKFKTPYKSTILVGLIISLVAAVTPINTVSEMCSMGTLLAFAMVCIAVWILRVKEPNLERPYKTPFLPVVACLGAGFNLFLMTQVRAHTWYAFLIWGALGILVYFLYSRKRSNLARLERGESMDDIQAELKQ
ncbi:MAG: amino acid permease [Bacteroidia bacterium]